MSLELSDVERSGPAGPAGSFRNPDKRNGRTVEQYSRHGGTAAFRRHDRYRTAGPSDIGFQRRCGPETADDAITEENHRTEYQACAPAVENGLYLVPKVIE